MSDLPIRTRSITVEVNKETIKKAERKVSSHCMIAEAIRKRYPEFNHVSVDLATIRMTDPRPNVNQRYVYFTPPAAQHAIAMFDSGKHVPGFRFTLGPRQLAQMQEIDRRKAQKKRKFKKLVDKLRGKKFAKIKVGKKQTRKVEVVKAGSHKRPLVPSHRKIPKVGQRRAFGLKSLAKMFKDSRN